MSTKQKHQTNTKVKNELKRTAHASRVIYAINNAATSREKKDYAKVAGTASSFVCNEVSNEILGRTGNNFILELGLSALSLAVGSLVEQKFNDTFFDEYDDETESTCIVKRLKN